MTLSEVSTGRTFSSMTEGTSSIALRRQQCLQDLETLHRHEVSRLHSEVPFPDEIELGGTSNRPTDPGARVEYPPLFPWTFEFSWEDGHLFFSGEPFTVEKEVHSWSQVKIAGSEKASTASGSTFRAYGADLHYDADLELSGQVSGVSHETLERVINLLDDHYWRTYRPQLSDKRNSSPRTGGQKSKEARSSPYPKTTTSRHSTKAAPSRRGKVSHGPGDGEDEDGHDGEKLPSSAMARANRRHFACPFMKWRPCQFQEDCLAKKFLKISYVKRHLVEKHYPWYCTACFTVYGDEVLLAAHKRFCCVQRHVEDTPFMTDEKYEAINKRADSNKTHEEQWQYIFGVLFPNEPRCPSPYLDDILVEMTEHLERYFEGPGRQLLEVLSIERATEYSGSREDMMAAYDFIREVWLPQALVQLPELGGSGPWFHQPTLSGSSSADSTIQNPGIQAGSIQQDVGFMESDPGYLTASNAYAPSLPMPDSHVDFGLDFERASHGGQPDSAAQPYVDGSLDWAVNPQGPSVDGRHDNGWDPTVGFHGFPVMDQDLLSQPLLSPFLTHQVNLDGNAGDFPDFSFPAGTFFCRACRAWGACREHDTRESNGLYLDPEAVERGTLV